MHSRLHTYAAAIGLGLALTGCVQATRHSNTMIFGTNTQFGIRAGTTPSSVPEVNIGYSRQEAVVMPLVANAADNGRYQRPCNLAASVETDGAAFAVHPCSLVAVNGKVQDSYSVLASFGAKFEGGATNGASAKGGLAQYFATGVAAQLLALSGGASVVAVGDAASAAATAKPASPATVEALFGNESLFSKGVGYRDAYSQFRSRILAKIELTDAATLTQKITKFEIDAGVSAMGIAQDCTDRAACKVALIDNDPYRSVYGPNKTKFDAAFDAWGVP